MSTGRESIRRSISDHNPLSVTHLPVVTFVAVCYLLVTRLESALASLFSLPYLGTVELVAALPVPLVISLGPAALWGIPVGYVLGDAASNAAGPGTLVGAGAHLYFGYSAGKLARRFGFDRIVSPSLLVQPAALGRFLLLAGVSAAGGAAVAGWGSEIVHAVPFYLAVVGAFVEYFLLTALLAVPLLGLFRPMATTATRWFDIQFPRLDTMNGRFSLRWVVSITLAWILLGAVGSVGYRTFQTYPPEVYIDRNLDVLLLLDQPALFGPGAGRLQVLFGAVCLSALLVVFAGRARSDGVNHT